MNGSLSKIISIFIVAVMMFILPVKINMQRQQEVIQTYILSETIYFVDNIRNTGHLSEKMYLNYLDKVNNVNGKVKIEIMVCEENMEDTYYIEQIEKELENSSNCAFAKNDYIRVCVKEGEKVIAYYGGMVKQ